MQGEAAGKAVNRLELVAVENRDVVVARLHHHEQIERVGAKNRLVRQAAGFDRLDPRGPNLRLAPLRHDRWRGVDEIGQRLDFLRLEPVLEAEHLRGRSPGRDDAQGFGLFQPLQILRQQRRPHSAQTVGTVAGNTMLLIQRGGVGRGASRNAKSHQGGKQQAIPHDAALRRALRYGVTVSRSPPAATPISRSSR